MYRTFVGRNANNLYHQALREISQSGLKVAPRGKPTLEIQAVTTILSPQERVLTAPGRGNNPFFNVAENLAILYALEEQRWLLQFNKNLENFFDNNTDEQMWAFYGTRLRKFDGGDSEWVYIDQLQNITQKLQDDPDSRQAVATLWDPRLDNERGHKDYPCNFAVEFKIRDGKLNMTVINRSNDIHWGLFGVNTSQFSFIQEVLAAILEVPMGEQTHVSDSLHLYLEEPHRTITKRMGRYKPFDIYELTQPEPMFRGPISWEEIDMLLTKFFKEFNAPTKNPENTPDFGKNFNFLYDAYVALSAYQVRKDDEQALALLNKIEDNALWVACVEFLTRLRKDYRPNDNPRFQRILAQTSTRFPSEYALVVINYIYHWIWADTEDVKNPNVA